MVPVLAAACFGSWLVSAAAWPRFLPRPNLCHISEHLGLCVHCNVRHTIGQYLLTPAYNTYSLCVCVWVRVGAEGAAARCHEAPHRTGAWPERHCTGLQVRGHLNGSELTATLPYLNLTPYCLTLGLQQQYRATPYRYSVLRCTACAGCSAPSSMVQHWATCRF